MRKVDWCIAGNGCVGSAVAAELLKRLRGKNIGDSVLLLSGSAPSSHNDQGRLARIVDAEGDARWVTANAGSIARMKARERESGVRFHSPSGSAVIGPIGMIDDLRAAHHHQHTEGAIKFEDARSLQSRLPFVHVPDTHAGLCEGPLETGGDSGYVNPIDMIRANNVVFQNDGGSIVHTAVSRIDLNGPCGAVTITNEDGSCIEAQHVLVACGGFTDAVLAGSFEATGLPPFRNRISKRTVVMAEVAEHQLSKFSRMPVLKYVVPQASQQGAAAQSQHDAMEEATVYILPPVQYPNGRTYIKLGGGANQWLDCQPADDPEAAGALVLEWMGGPGCPLQAEQLRSALAAVLPALEPASYATKACFTTCSATTSHIEARRLGRVAAVGTCHGKSAGPSLQLGWDIADWLLSSASSGSDHPAGVQEFQMPLPPVPLPLPVSPGVSPTPTPKL